MKVYESKAEFVTLKRQKSDLYKAKISNSQDSAKYARQFYHEDLTIYESVFIMCLNQRHNVIGYAKISQGGICSTIIDVRLICKYAIDTQSSAIIVVHNHPSGNLNPSNADKEITVKIKNALSFFDISLLDHVIITEDSYYSFSDDNKL